MSGRSVTPHCARRTSHKALCTVHNALCTSHFALIRYYSPNWVMFSLAGSDRMPLKEPTWHRLEPSRAFQTKLQTSSRRRHVVRVAGRRRPISVVVCAPDAVLTMARAIGREPGLSIRTDDGRTLSAEVAGWDQTTALTVLVEVERRAIDPAATGACRQRRHRHRPQWSNALTASTGIVSVIGGPLPTGAGDRSAGHSHHGADARGCGRRVSRHER